MKGDVDVERLQKRVERLENLVTHMIEMLGDPREWKLIQAKTEDPLDGQTVFITKEIEGLSSRGPSIDLN